VHKHFQKLLYQYRFFCGLLLCLLPYVCNLWNGVMEVDAALYAGIAKRMAQQQDWINLFADGHDWLDKPHLPFWITAASFSIFGINDFAVKFPALLSLFLCTRYCYLLARLVAGTQVAQYSSIIFLSSLHLYLAYFDVRAEAYLTTFIAAAIYHYLQLFTKVDWKHLLAASIFTAAAICTKGIFTAITIYAGFGCYWIFTKQWRLFVQPALWVSLIITAVLLIPELLCLYLQFDAHPEKIVFGQTGVSGIRFFFWDSQFGRFFNNGPIKGSGDPLFFVHTLLWALLPTSAMVYPAWYKAAKNSIYAKNNILVIVSTTIVTFLLFSLSRFQLPHYIVILFPLFAIFLACYTQQLSAAAYRVWQMVQTAIFVLVIIAVAGVSWLSGFANWWVAAGLTIIAVAIFYGCHLLAIRKIWATMVCTAMVLYGYLALVFYPHLLNYQGGEAAAAWLNIHHPKAAPYFYKTGSYSFEWKANPKMERILTDEKLQQLIAVQHQVLVFAQQDSLPANGKFLVTPIKTFPHYPITQLNGNFLNRQTRQQELKQVCIAIIQAIPGRR
jgi:4-amino-4-deoxy-L-arabinose transferase-like glycosyltransferase